MDIHEQIQLLLKKKKKKSGVLPTPPSTEVALQLMRGLFLEKVSLEKNIVFSPISIYVVLSLITAGTKGLNREKKLDVLKAKSIAELNALASKVYPLAFADGSKEGGPIVLFANGVWIEKSLPLLPSFKKVVKNVYKADLEQVDFKKNPKSARNKVNNWGEKHAKVRIRSVIPPEAIKNEEYEETKMIIANAIYFKGEWVDKFKKLNTHKDDFYLLNNAGPVKTLFMSDPTSYKYVRVFEDFKVCKLPYKRGENQKQNYSMYIFLPNENNGLRSLINKVCSSSEFIESHIPDSSIKVRKFLIPKFKITYNFPALKLVESLGFSGEDLTEIVIHPKPLEVSEIYQKAFIEVSEAGTEAAAVTGSNMIMRYTMSQPIITYIDFVADHPFIYLIREDTTKTIMFIGQFVNPTKN